MSQHPKRKLVRLGASLAGMALAFGSFPLIAAATPDDGAAPTTRALAPGASAGPAGPPAPQELISRRTRDSKTYRNPNGTFTGVFENYLHYEATPGRFEDVNLDFRRQGADDVADRHDLVVRVRDEGVQVTERATGEGVRWLTPSRPSANGGQAGFADQGLDWEYTNTKGGLKLAATVSSRQGPRTYRFPYQLLGGAAELTVAPDGGLVSDRFRVPRAVAIGADLLEYPASSWRVLPGGRVAFDFDDADLPGTAFPYELDPSTTFVVASGADDGRVIAEGNANPPPVTGTNTSSAWSKVDRYHSTACSGCEYGISNVLMRWNTSALPDNAVLNAATLSTSLCYAQSPDGRSLTADWYTAWPIDNADYSPTAQTTALVGKSIAALAASRSSSACVWGPPDPAPSQILLDNAAGVVKDLVANGGYTGLRFHISGVAPTDPYSVTQVAFTTNEWVAQEPRLVVNFTVPIQPRENPTGNNPAEACRTQNQVGRPVNTASGNFWHDFTDFAVPGRGPGLHLSRTYNTIHAGEDSLFGFGWSSCAAMTLKVDPGTGDATIHQEDGSEVTFATNGGSYIPLSRVIATLVHNGDGTWTYNRRAKDIFTFDSTGRLVSKRDRNAYATTWSYPNATTMVMTDSSGRTLTFTLTGSRVTSVTDTASPARTLTYSYDGSGNLTDVIDVGGGHWQFTYDGSHRMLTMREPKYFGDTNSTPSPVTTNHYDGSGRVDWQSDPLGRTTSFDYTSIAGATKITDGKGNVSVDYYTNGVRTAETRGYGTAQAATFAYEFDDLTSEITKVTDPNNKVTTSTYDARGNRLTSVDPLLRQTIWTYNGFDLPLAMRDPLNVTTTWTYDASGNLLTESTPLVGSSPAVSKTTTYTYGDGPHPGDVTSVTDPDGKVWPRTWDATGNLASSADPLGNVTQYCYDNVSRRTKVISPRGSAAGVTCATPAPGFTTIVTPDAYGEPLVVKDALGHETTTSYDLNRNPTSVIDANRHAVTSDYDPAGQLVATTRSSAPLSFFDHWSAADASPWNTPKWVTTATSGNQATDVTGNEGRLWVNSPSAAARASAQMTAVADSEVNLRYRFDSRTAESFLRLSLRGSGATGANELTSAYRLDVESDSSTIAVKKVVAGVATTIDSFTHTMDTASQRVRFGVQGSTVRAKVWPATASEPLGWNVEVTDTAVGGTGIVQLAHAATSATSRNVYVDDLSVSDPNVSPPPPGLFADDWTGTTLAPWNPAKWATTSNDASKKADIEANEGRLYTNGSTVRATAQMTAVADSEVTLTHRFSDRTAKSYLRINLRASGATGSSQMPNAYRLEIDSDSSTVEVQKFVNSVVTDLGSFSVTPLDLAARRIRFQVQGATIRAKIWLVGAAEPSSWNVSVTDSTLTGPGVLQISHSQAIGTRSVFLDDLAVNDLAAQPSTAPAIVRHEYWGDGSLKIYFDGSGRATSYAYDPLGRLLTVTDPLGRVTTSGYDPGGRLVSKQDHGGNCAAIPKINCTTMGYDDASQLKTITYSDGVTPNVTNINYDSDGQRTAMTDGTGTSTWAWDSLHRLTSHTNGASQSAGYAYDLRGNVTAITYPGATGSVTRTFDNAGRLSKVKDWLNNESVFSYDADSFLAAQAYPNATTANYTPDAADRLTAMSHAPTASPGSPFAAFSYGRDDANQLSAVASTGLSNTRGFAYTGQSQLATDTLATDPLRYDGADNLTQLGNGTVQNYDDANELTASSAITLVGATGAGDNAVTSSLPVTLPVGVVANDQILLAATLPGDQSASTPSGYTLVGTWSSGAGPTNTKLTVFRKTAAGGETSVTVAFGTAYAKAVTAAVYRGVDPTTPLDGSAQGASAAPGTSVTVSAPTIGTAGDRLVMALGATAAGSTGNWTVPKAMTRRVQQVVSTTMVAALADTVLPSTAAPGSQKASFSPSAQLVGAVLALKPATSTTYGYDTRGNRTSITSGATTTLAHDQANRLTGYGALNTYAYNGDGLRMSKTVTGLTTAFTWDQAQGLPLLLVEGTTKYVYGPGGLPLEQITGAGVVSYYHHDQLGSTRALTSAAGVVVATYTYDPYGKLTASTGGITNPFRYAGQYTDAETGLVYLRARYYEPGTGTFLTVDPAFGLTRERYGYVGGNPLNRTDSTGLLFGLDNLIAGGVGAFGGALGSVGSQLITTGGVNWVKVGIAGAAGGVAGAAFLTCGWCAGAAAGFVNDTATQLYEKRTLDIGAVNFGQTAVATISGGAFGSLFDLPGQLNQAMGLEASRAFASLWGIFGGTLGAGGAGLLTSLYGSPGLKGAGCESR